MADAISRRELADLVKDQLASLPKGTVYVGEITDTPPVVQTGGQPDPSGRVAPYVVIHGGDGQPLDERAIAQTAGDSLTWPFTVTAAAGFHADALELLGQLHTLLDEWVPDHDDYLFGPTRAPAGFDPGPVRLDRSVKPPRHTLALQFVITAHR